MYFRKAVEQDARRLAEANRELIRDEWWEPGSEPPPLSELEPRMLNWIQGDEYHVIVFEEQDEAVGYALFSADEDSAYVRHFYIFPEHRGKGYGKSAFQLLLNEIIPPTARITLDVLARNQEGYNFWRSVGFNDYSVRMEIPSESRRKSAQSIPQRSHTAAQHSAS